MGEMLLVKIKATAAAISSALTCRADSMVERRFSSGVTETKLVSPLGWAMVAAEDCADIPMEDVFRFWAHGLSLGDWGLGCYSIGLVSGRVMPAIERVRFGMPGREVRRLGGFPSRSRGGLNTHTQTSIQQHASGHCQRYFVCAQSQQCLPEYAFSRSMYAPFDGPAHPPRTSAADADMPPSQRLQIRRRPSTTLYTLSRPSQDTRRRNRRRISGQTSAKRSCIGSTSPSYAHRH